MISALRRWFGLKCWLGECGGKIGHFDPDRPGKICWRCSQCGKTIE